MKALFLISGEIRSGDLQTKYSVEHIKKCLPDIDVKCITWERGERHEFVDKYYDEPKATYYPENSWSHLKSRIELLRQLKNSGAEWPPKDNVDFEIITQRFSKSSSNRNRWKKRHFQILQHALGVDDFGYGYDIIIRSRYDYVFRNYEHIYRAIDFLSTTKNTIVEIGPTYEEDKTLAFPDHEIFHYDFQFAHHYETFDTDYIWKLHSEKKLLGAESGWTQAFKLGTTESPALRRMYGLKPSNQGFNNIIDFFSRMDDLTEEEVSFYERYKAEEKESRS